MFLTQVPTEAFPLLSDDALVTFAAALPTVRSPRTRDALAEEILARGHVLAAFALLRSQYNFRLKPPTVGQVLHALASKDEASEHWLKYAFPKSTSSRLVRGLHSITFDYLYTPDGPGFSWRDLWRTLHAPAITISKEDVVSTIQTLNGWLPILATATWPWVGAKVRSEAGAIAFQRQTLAGLYDAPITGMILDSEVEEWSFQSPTEALRRVGTLDGTYHWNAQTWANFFSLCPGRNLAEDVPSLIAAVNAA